MITKPGIKTTVLPSGAVVRSEFIPHVETCSVGIWLDIGSRDETLATNGVAHFFEHMVFKGSKKRSGLEIVQSIESRGGQINAFTTKEHTCFYLKILPEQLTLGLDILLDMVFNPLLSESDVKKEKEVVIEEIKGCDDSPDDRVYDLFGPALYSTAGVAYPIAGSVKSVRGLHQKELRAHLKRIRERAPIYITCAGKVNHNQVLGQIRAFFKKEDTRNYSRGLGRAKAIRQKPSQIHASMKIQQTNVMMGGPGYSVADPMLLPLTLLNALVGEGMSSRLFQKLREELGCVYSINSFLDGMVGTGLFGLSFSADPASMSKALKAIGDVFGEIRQNPFTESDLATAKTFVKGGFLIENESVQSRMVFLARTAMYGGPIKTQRDYIRAIEAVTLVELRAAFKHISNPLEWGVATVGPGKRLDVLGKLRF